MNRVEQATGEICQFLNDHIELVVPVEWHTRIAEIINRNFPGDPEITHEWGFNCPKCGKDHLS